MFASLISEKQVLVIVHLIKLVNYNFPEESMNKNSTEVMLLESSTTKFRKRNLNPINLVLVSTTGDPAYILLVKDARNLNSQA